MKRAHLQPDALSAICYLERLSKALLDQGDISEARRIRCCAREVARLLTARSERLLYQGIRVVYPNERTKA